LAHNSKEARDREGAKAKAQYEAEGQAVREKTARLKSLRLAKEAAESETGVKKETVTATHKKKLVTPKAKPLPLSEWLTAQRGAGRRG